jgi:hypothetical protein
MPLIITRTERRHMTDPSHWLESFEEKDEESG